MPKWYAIPACNVNPFPNWLCNVGCPLVKHQRCWAHKLRNIADKVNRVDREACPLRRQADLSRSAPQGRPPGLQALAGPLDQSVSQSRRLLEKDLDTLLTFFDFPAEMREHIRTTNFIERSFKEVRRRTRPIGCFNNAESCERIMYAVFDLPEL